MLQVLIKDAGPGGGRSVGAGNAYEKHELVISGAGLIPAAREK